MAESTLLFRLHIDFLQSLALGGVRLEDGAEAAVFDHAVLKGDVIEDI